MSNEEKSKAQKLQDKLSYKPSSAWEKYSEKKEKIFKFSEGFKQFLNIAKTEREFVYHSIKVALENGYTDLNSLISSGEELRPGTKVFYNVKNKSLLLAVIGQEPLINGVNMVGAHIDSPRIDIKQNPMYEKDDMTFLKTHYYGGIKKYQWVTMPLALHGTIVKKNGEVLNVIIGENENDPVFSITDLLPHLAKDQMEKKMSEGINGEDLNVLIGSIPYDDCDLKDKVKLNILNILFEKYGIIEEDFLSSELEIVPAFKARDIGFDRGMVGAYGQDDRVCAYPALMSILKIDSPQKTAVCVLTDKEEIGSMGNTGAESRLLENFIARLCAYTTQNYNDIVIRTCLENSYMLSADVSAAVDPTYEGTHDKLNASFAGKGITIMKYSGSRGKSGASDANAEFIGKIRSIFNDNNIIWQTTELGKVDKGGGGTIAQYVANLGVEVIDCGVPVLSMHAPFEITSKADIYMTFKAYKAFFENCKYFFKILFKKSYNKLYLFFNFCFYF